MFLLLSRDILKIPVILSIIISLYPISFLLHAVYDNNFLFAYAELITTNSSNQFIGCNINISEISSKKITLGDIDIAYKIFGKGKYPLVLISA
jgi:hypothetical protein